MIKLRCYFIESTIDYNIIVVNTRYYKYGFLKLNTIASLIKIYFTKNCI